MQPTVGRVGGPIAPIERIPWKVTAAPCYRPKRCALCDAGEPVKPMPAYYFHILDNGALIEDRDGLELPDLHAARAECKRLIISVLQEEQLGEEFSANREFQIVDETGRIVLEIPFRLAVSAVRVTGG